MAGEAAVEVAVKVEGLLAALEPEFVATLQLEDGLVGGAGPGLALAPGREDLLSVVHQPGTRL